jgi:hypothetical protein
MGIYICFIREASERNGGKNTAVIKGMGMVFATSYVRDGQLIKLKGDTSDLLFTVKDDKTLVCEGFGEGIYKKY